ncbi:NAD(P)/FAD-dependent oxidoreductase [soil metagenome]
MTGSGQDTDVLVIGGGAAGLMCAIAAGRRGRRVRVLERANRCGKKILMSGGGRCNFTNTGTTPANFLSANPHFCKSALARFTPAAFIAMVDAHGIAWHEKELGQLFCDDSSKQILAMLLAECDAAGVRVDTAATIDRVEARPGGGFSAQTSLGTITSEACVVASGGLSIPSLGGSAFGYELAKQFGHAVLPLRAGLVPLTLSGTHQDYFAELAGVSLPVTARSGKAHFDNAMLVTHRGLSGPAILQISNYWDTGAELRLDLLPGQDAARVLVEAQRAQPGAELRTVLSGLLPRRLAERLCERSFVSRPMRQFSPGELAELAARLADWPIVASGTEGYRTAEVTLGGVDTQGLSSRTMESTSVPGLFFIGEVVDVTGLLCGYNFQWAWASGHAAGEVA